MQAIRAAGNNKTSTFSQSHALPRDVSPEDVPGSSPDFPAVSADGQEHKVS